MRARPSDRRLRRAHPRYPHRRAAQIWPEAGHGEPVHRRRRGDGNGPGDRLKVTKRDLQNLLNRSKFIRHYGFKVVRTSSDACTIELPHKPLLERPGGIINGPALMAAADCAMWLAVKTRIGIEEDALTSELNT